MLFVFALIITFTLILSVVIVVCTVNFGKKENPSIFNSRNIVSVETPRGLSYIRTIHDSYITEILDGFFDTNDFEVEYPGNRPVLSNARGEKIGIVTSYHYQHPEDEIERLKKQGIPVLVLDGEPNPFPNAILDENDIIITTKLDPTLLPEKGNKIYNPYYVHHLLFKEHLLPDVLIKNFLDTNVSDTDTNTSSNTDTNTSSNVITSRPPKTEFCCFAYSNDDEKFKGVKDRKNFYYLLQEKSGNRVKNYGRSCGGTLRNQDSAGIKNSEMFAPFKFVISFENQQIEGYISEKLITPMMANAIPIYLGAPDVGKHFNTKSFISVRDFDSFEDCIDYVLKVDADQELYESILREPWFVDNKPNHYFNEVLMKNSSFFQSLSEKTQQISKSLFQKRLILPQKINLVTFSDGIKYTFDRIVREAHLSKYFDEIFACSPEDLGKDFFEKHKTFINSNKRGYGYWIWKPQIILQTLEKIQENDILIWCDSGSTIQGGNSDKLSQYVNLLNSNEGMIGFSIKHIAKNWTKRSLIEYITEKYSLDNDKINSYLESPQATSGIIMMRRCEKTINVIKDWRDVMENYNLINDELNNEAPYLKEHRHDQSVWDLIAKIHNVEMVIDNFSDSTNDNLYENGDKKIIYLSRKKR